MATILLPGQTPIQSGQVDLTWRNIEQEIYFWSTFRNNCFSGGFGNGKTYVACARQYTMLATFPGYVSLFARQYYKDLKATTMKTFFKICPADFVLKHDIQEGITIFKNGSVALWMHLDAFDEQSLRGLEINSALLDQVEEIEESIYLVMDSRIGRWDGAKVPQYLLDACPTWPRAADGRPRVRNFVDVLCNPDNEFHWVYRRYHPDSLERKKNHFYIERATDDTLNDPETIENMKDRDPEWTERYYDGKWGKSQAQIHKINPLSILDPDSYDPKEFEDFLKRILNRGSLYRAFDYGETSPSCCLWFCAINKIHICYREYYAPDKGISEHRYAIDELSKNPFTGFLEEYELDIADPSIFYKTARQGTGKNNFKTAVADEFITDEISGPPIYWTPGDNNELATRNRINDLLKESFRYAHPITKVSPAPGLYFIKRTDKYIYGAFQAILQLQKQRREIEGSDNGKTIYNDNRAENIVDHAYDPTRYYVAEHSSSKSEESRVPPERSFANFERLRLRKPIFVPNY